MSEQENEMIIKKKGRMRAIALVLLALLILVGGIASAVLLDVQLKHVDKLFDSVEAAEEAPVAIVLGASVMRNGDPSPALRDRLLVGESLYEQGKVSSILITGDDGGFHIDEIKTMREFLLARGIPHEHIREDGHGYRTYESCKRAKEIFGIEKAIVVTQRFHIGRALYLCNELGIETNGVSSDLTSYDNILRFMFRDIGASLKAWWDVNVKAPEPPVEY